MKPICVPCQRFYRIKKNGFYFIEGMPKVSEARPGNKHPDEWKPYRLWSGDLWECQGCGSQIISGRGLAPIRVQHERDFHQEIDRLGAQQFQVNDC